MNIYEYNSSTINKYSQEDFGILTHSSLEMDDFGDLSNSINDSEDFFCVNCKETLIPFGRIKVFNNKTKYFKKISIFEKCIDLNSKSIILYGIILRWIGFSVIFQLSNDLQRKVIPDVSGGGHR